MTQDHKAAVTTLFVLVLAIILAIATRTLGELGPIIVWAGVIWTAVIAVGLSDWTRG